MMRVAVVAYHSNPLNEPGSGDAGGMSIYVRALAREMARRGVHTDIFTRSTGESSRISHLGRGTRVIALPAGPEEIIPKEEQRRYIADFVVSVRAFASSQRARYDLVHSHYWQGGLAATALARGWSVPLVHSHHTLGRVKNMYLAPGDAPEAAYRIEAEQSVIAAADVLVTLTEEEQAHLVCMYGAPHDRIKTIAPGVDHERFAPGDRAAARRELGIEDELVLLAAGRIQPLKGLDLAIDTVAELVPALDRPVSLAVVGGPSGPAGRSEMERLMARARALGIEENVRFAGPQPHDRLPTYYRAADAVLVCSYSESFGLVGLEAMASGTPVVGTAVGGLTHLVRGGVGGFVVEERDAAAFAAQLKQVLADEDTRAAFGRAAARSAAVYSWSRSAAAMLDLYECLLEEQAPEACTC
ncbi:MAG TPA: glycosyltransferase [Actinomycetota bacterium]|jgi:D-inositol-3-phosphate glycosyltransferase|nr:glycosyltransferase [Actinomycetota bacterium]